MCVCTANPGRLVSYVQGHLAWDSEGRPAPRLHVNDKLGVSVGESSKLVLVQVHDEEFVRGRELHRLPGELFVEVGSVAFVFLLNGKHRVKAGKEGEVTAPPGGVPAGAELSQRSSTGQELTALYNRSGPAPPARKGEQEVKHA